MQADVFKSASPSEYQYALSPRLRDCSRRGQLQPKRSNDTIQADQCNDADGTFVLYDSFSRARHYMRRRKSESACRGHGENAPQAVAGSAEHSHSTTAAALYSCHAGCVTP